MHQIDIMDSEDGSYGLRLAGAAYRSETDTAQQLAQRQEDDAFGTQRSLDRSPVMSASPILVPGDGRFQILSFFTSVIVLR